MRELKLYFYPSVGGYTKKKNEKKEKKKKHWSRRDIMLRYQTWTRSSRGKKQGVFGKFSGIKVPNLWSVPVLGRLTAIIWVTVSAKFGTVNSHTAKKLPSTLIPPRKYRQYWIPPRKYRQYWIPPKRHRQYWIPPKRYRQHWIPPKRHRLFFLVFMFSSATPHSWFIFISSGYVYYSCD